MTSCFPSDRMSASGMLLNSPTGRPTGHVLNSLPSRPAWGHAHRKGGCFLSLTLWEGARQAPRVPCLGPLPRSPAIAASPSSTGGPFLPDPGDLPHALTGSSPLPRESSHCQAPLGTPRRKRLRGQTCLGTMCNLSGHQCLLSTQCMPGPGSAFTPLLSAALRTGPQDPTPLKDSAQRGKDSTGPMASRGTQGSRSPHTHISSHQYRCLGTPFN